MSTVEARPPLQPGELAPDFTLPAVQSEGVVSLADYRGRTPVLLSINRGLWCPFCRRHIAHLDTTRQRLEPLGVETLAIVATEPERARLYVRYHPTGVPLAADPELATHRSYGLPKPPLTPELIQTAQGLRLNPMGALPAPVPMLELNEAVNRLDGFELNDTDRFDHERQFGTGPQLTGQFLVDREGVVRWVNIECGKEGLAGAGKFPSEEEFLAAARALPT